MIDIYFSIYYQLSLSNFLILSKFHLIFFVLPISFLFFSFFLKLSFFNFVFLFSTYSILFNFLVPVLNCLIFFSNSFIASFRKLLSLIVFFPKLVYYPFWFLPNILIEIFLYLLVQTQIRFLFNVAILIHLLRVFLFINSDSLNFIELNLYYLTNLAHLISWFLLFFLILLLFLFCSILPTFAFG